MSTRKTLSGVAMAVLFMGCRAAIASSCAPALSDVDVKDGFKVEADCGFPVRTLDRMTTGLSRAAKAAGLSNVQMVSLARAANVILSAVYGQSSRIDRKTDTPVTNIEPLIEHLAEQLRAQPDVDLVAEAQQWAARYEDLLRRRSIARSSDPLEVQVNEALGRVDLEGASKRLGTLLAEKQETQQVFAARCYEAAEIELLRFSPLNALPFLEKAYALQPENADIATAFADTLREQREFERAAPIYHTLLSRYQVLAQEKPAAYQPRIARTQEKLGNLYVGLQRPKEAEVAYLRALEIYWALARQDPAAYGPAVAETFDNLGVLYRDTQRLQEAADAYREALSIDRALAYRDPKTYKPEIATTLNDLAILYDAAQRTSDAEKAYRESLNIQRALVRGNPAAYRPALARTLNNLGNLYSAMQRHEEAEHAYKEALTIRQQLGRESPALYRPDVARTLTNLGALYRATQRPAAAKQAYQDALQIYRALARDNPTAYQPDEARTLNNLGVLFSHTGRPREAEDAYRNALDLYRTLSRDDPMAYRQDEARTLGNLGALFSQFRRPREAEQARREAARLLDATQAP
ncbi:tetratricopeptide repeat protein [Paraburkholderia panacisoli]|uniref:Tetratricopeptide repeat protein n=1 Tax=Paraburkholderia panacisoli TaxID=2603818 RepID=A0A5B0H3W7_9BURK|nr:tetratricopeptide repeat protein [Paraburkholderia panacisoli]